MSGETNLGKVALYLTLEDQGFSSNLDKAKGKSEDFAKKVDSTITKASLVATAGLAGMGIAAIKSAADFQKGISDVGAIAQATDKQLTELSDTALRIGKDTQYSATEATKAMKELAAGGVETSDIIQGAADAVVALAAAGGTDLATAANVAASAMTVWGIAADDLTRVVNDIAGAANVSKFGVEDMSLAIAQGGGVAASAGVSFDDFSAAIAATASSFSSGSDAGTSFKTFLTALAAPTDKARQAMEDLGFSAYDAQGNLKSMAQITQDLHDKLGPLSQQQRAQAAATIFGSDAMRTALGLTRLTGDEFQSLSDKMRNSDAAEIAAKRMDNLAGDIEQLKGSLETAAIAMGTKAIPALSATAGGVTEAVNAFSELPGSTQNIVLLGTAVAASMPLVVSGFNRAEKALRDWNTIAGSTKAQATALAVGVGAVAVGLDALVTKMSGHSLQDILFGDPVAEDAGEKFAASVKKAIAAAGSLRQEADPLTVTMDTFRDSLGYVNDIGDRVGIMYLGMGQSVEHLYTRQEELNGIMAKGTLYFHEHSESVKQVAEAMMAGKATAQQYTDVHNLLGGALQDLFDKTVGYDQIMKKLAESERLANEETIRGEKVHLDLSHAQDVLINSTPLVTQAFADYDRIVSDAESSTKDLEKALGALDEMFAKSNPQVIAANAEHARLTEEMDRLKAKGLEMTAADKARVDLIEKQLIPALDKEIEGHQRQQDAIDGEAGALKGLLGEKGYYALRDVLMSLKVPYDDQVVLNGNLSKAYYSLQHNDIPGVITKYGELKKTLDPQVWAVIAQAVGPELARQIKESMTGQQMAEAYEAAKKVGIDIVDGVIQGMAYTERFLSAQAREMARRTVDEMHSGIQAGSPSKLSADEVGVPIVEGVIMGMEQMREPLMAVAVGLARDAVQAAAAEVAKASKNAAAYVQTSGAASPGGVTGPGGGGPVPEKDANGNIAGIQGYDAVWTPGKGWEYVPIAYEGTAPGQITMIRLPDGTLQPHWDDYSLHPGQYWDGSAWRSLNVNNPTLNPNYGQSQTQPGGFHIDTKTGQLVPNAGTVPTMGGNTLPHFDTGIDYVPHDMLAVIHRGEAVVTASENRGGGRGFNVTLNVTVNGEVSPETVSRVKQAMFEVIDEWKDNELGYGAMQWGSRPVAR